MAADPSPGPVPADEHLVVIRGGGDLATGVAWRLTRAGLAVIVTELADPLTVRRTVALSSAVTDGVVDVEGMVGRRVADRHEAVEVARGGRDDPDRRGQVAVLVSPGLPAVGAAVVIDARLAKTNLDTSIDDAPLVVALGPGFRAGVDCHAVVETMRGPHLGRVIWDGPAAPDTGTPGLVGAAGSRRGAERVLRAPVAGVVSWAVTIGDQVDEGDRLGLVEGADEGGEVVAPFTGVVRGLIRPGRVVECGLKIGDVDPRLDTDADLISDKALAIGGGATEAVLTWLTRSR